MYIEPLGELDNRIPKLWERIQAKEHRVKQKSYL